MYPATNNYVLYYNFSLFFYKNYDVNIKLPLCTNYYVIVYYYVSITRI